MSETGPPLDQLLENRHWLRRLAVQLLHDPSHVDDVLQNVWMAALRQPPRESHPRSQRSWLKKVLRTFALRANRSEARRSRWENDSPEPTPPPNADQMVERLEMQSALAASIQMLDEPYRSVVFLRFYEDRSPREISVALDTPESTVRTQLSRGLATLREHLDRESKRRGTDWRATLMMIVGGTYGVPWNPGADPQGMPKPSTRPPGNPAPFATRFAWIILALVGGGLVLLIDPSETKPLADLQQIPNRGATDPNRVAEPGRRDSARSDKAASVTVPSRVKGVDSSTTESNLTRGEPNDDSSGEDPTITIPSITVQVIDGVSGDPLPGATVAFAAPDDAKPVPAPGRTDDDGRLDVDRKRLARDAMVVYCPGYVDVREPLRFRTLEPSPYVISMEPMFEARVRVLIEGKPAAEVPIEIQHASHDESTTVVTDSAGIASFDYRDPQTRIVIDHPPFARQSISAEGEETELQLVIGREVSALLLDELGIPLENCRVIWTSSSGQTWPSEAYSDHRGRVALGLQRSEATLSLRIYPDDRPSYRYEGIPPVDGDWIVEIPRGVYLQGVLDLSEGAHSIGVDLTAALPFLTVRREIAPEAPGAIASMDARKPSRSARAKYRLHPLKRGSVDPDGRFRVGPIPGDVEDVYLLIHHPDLVNRIVPVPDLAQPRPRRIRLELGVIVTGVAIDSDGKPAAGTLLHIGERYSHETETVLGRTRTDANGRFTLRGLPSVRGDRLPEIRVDGRDVIREHVFVAAFSPERVVAYDDRTVEDSPVFGSAIVASDARHLTLVVAPRETANPTPQPESRGEKP